MFSAWVDWRYLRCTYLIFSIACACTVVGGVISGKHLVIGSVARGIIPIRWLLAPLPPTSFASINDKAIHFSAVALSALAQVLNFLFTPLMCATMGELVMSTAALVLICGDIERVSGGTRVASWAIWAFIAQILLRLLLDIIVIGFVAVGSVTIGVHWLVVSLAIIRRHLLVPFRCIVVAGRLQVSELIFGDILAFMAVWSSQRYGPALLGLAIGRLLASPLFQKNVMGKFSLVPTFLSIWLDRPTVSVMFFPKETQQQSQSSNAGRRLGGAARIRGSRAGAAVPAQSSTQPVDPTQVTIISNLLGVAEDRARTALQRSGGDPTGAINLLLDGVVGL